MVTPRRARRRSQAKTRVVEGRRIAAGADEDDVGRRARSLVPQSGMMATPFEAVDRLAAGRGVPPAVQRPARELVGGAQGSTAAA